MSTKLTVTYWLSDAYRRRQFVETGELPEHKQTLTFDMAEATPEQRAVIVRQIGIEPTLEIKRWSIGSDKPYLALYELDNSLSLDDVVSHCQRMEDERTETSRTYDARQLDKIHVDILEKLVRLRECVDQRIIDDHVNLNSYLADDRKRLGVDLTDYNHLRAQYDVMAAERRVEMDAERAENERKRELAKAAREAEKLAWVQEHGSEYLRRACVAGHDCSRMYWRERAAIEYPGYIVDIENDGAWKSRSCPSIEALDERDAVLAAHPGVDVEIVWLTEMPHDRKPSDEYEDEFEPCEAVVVRAAGLPESLYPYDLVKIL